MSIKHLQLILMILQKSKIMLTQLNEIVRWWSQKRFERPSKSTLCIPQLYTTKKNYICYILIHSWLVFGLGLLEGGAIALQSWGLNTGPHRLHDWIYPHPSFYYFWIYFVCRLSTCDPASAIQVPKVTNLCHQTWLFCERMSAFFFFWDTAFLCRLTWNARAPCLGLWHARITGVHLHGQL